MMHHKALLFNDAAIAARVLKTKHPRDVKALGRKVANFSESEWVARREAIVRHGNILKFTRAVSEVGFQMGTSTTKNLPPLEASLRDMLVATGDREIVEATPYDWIWGIGFRERDASALREDWGSNLLGKALMEVRTILKEGEEHEQKKEFK